jgi:hypothetical protein
MLVSWGVVRSSHEAEQVSRTYWQGTETKGRSWPCISRQRLYYEKIMPIPDVIMYSSTVLPAESVSSLYTHISSHSSLRSNRRPRNRVRPTRSPRSTRRSARRPTRRATLAEETLRLRVAPRRAPRSASSLTI